MATEAKNWIEVAQSRWTALPARQRLILIAGIVTLIGASMLFSTKDPKSNMEILFSNLSDDDSARVVERLDTLHIPYEIDAEANAVRVPANQVHQTRLTLAAEGLPSGTGVGFEIFDEQRFGESEFSEQVKYHRALEGELSRSITHLAGVEKARVHLVLPSRSLFASSQSNASASVVIHLKPGWKMRDDQTRGILHLVASSVRGLQPEKVTIVDGQGRKLAGGENSEEERAEDVLGYRRAVEKAKEDAVQQLLDRTLGMNQAAVRVAADISFAREERTEETFYPEESASRSFQITEERDKQASGTAQGIPGAASNLPGGEPAQETISTEGLVRRTETRNFEISKTVRKAIEPVGRIERLHVAVVVDGKWSAVGKEKTKKFTARTKDELDRIRSIVASAAGINSIRGDEITVECVPFPSEEQARLFEEPPIDPLGPVRKYLPYGPYIGGLLGLILFIALVVTIIRRKPRLIPNVAAVLPIPATVRQLEEATGIKQAVLAAGTEQNKDNQEMRILAAELATEDPERAARIVRGWLGESA